MSRDGVAAGDALRRGELLCELRGGIRDPGHVFPIALEFRQLIDDLNYHKELNDERHALYIKLREDSRNAPDDPYPVLKQKHGDAIGEAVQRGIDRTAWWKG